jgi:hypothetical protein
MQTIYANRSASIITPAKNGIKRESGGLARRGICRKTTRNGTAGKPAG